MVELKIGMSCYSFSYKSSYLASMAREDFDFNVCIYDASCICWKHQNLLKSLLRINISYQDFWIPMNFPLKKLEGSGSLIGLTKQNSVGDNNATLSCCTGNYIPDIHQTF